VNDNVDNVFVQMSVIKVVNQNGLEARLTRHFRKVLSVGLDVKRWPGETSLPAFLLGSRLSMV
jgi:hypothetical protein